MPASFWANKLSFVSRTLGMSSPLITSARGIHGVDERTLSYGARPTPVQWSDRENFVRFTDSIGILTMRPWSMVSIFGALLLLGGMFKLDLSRFIPVFLVGIFYYLSFCVNTQAMEFRYYAPSFFLFFIGSACLLSTIIGHVIMTLIVHFKKRHLRRALRDSSYDILPV